MGDLLQPGDGEGKSLCLVLESWLGMQVSTKNEQQLQLKPHSGGLEIQQQEKKKKSSEQAKHCKIYLLIRLGGQRMDLRLAYIWSQRQWQRDWPSPLWEGKIRRLRMEESGIEACGWIHVSEHRVWRSLYHQPSTIEEESNNQVDKMTLSVDISLPLPSISTLGTWTETTQPQEHEVLLTKADPAIIKVQYRA